MKTILDTSVIIAAFASRGLCHAVFELCLDRCEIVLSEEILREVLMNLNRKIKLPLPQCEGSATKKLVRSINCIDRVGFSPYNLYVV